MEFIVFGEVQETKQCGIAMDTILLDEPELEMSLAPGQGPVKVGEEAKIAVRLVNTTRQTLTNLELSWQGRGLGRGRLRLPE